MKILIAETAPIILHGLRQCCNNIHEFNPSLIEADSKKSLFDCITTKSIDLIIVNPTFGGLLHPDDIRKNSINSNIKIFAIEIGKLNKTTLSLYDDHFHVTDDLKEITNKIRSAYGIPKGEEEKENLSLREKEIISFVVKGYTNQEIADKLFISVHTVMTHRRNIARKLQIHSATGLTIYAIVNKLVDLAELNL